MAGCHKRLCTNITHIRPLTSTSISALVLSYSKLSVRIVVHIMRVWFQPSVHMFVTGTGRTEGITTHARCRRFLKNYIFQRSGTFCHLARIILRVGFISLLHTYNLTCISEHHRTHIIHTPWQRITQYNVVSLIINMFTFIYITSQRARQSSPPIVPLSTFITDRGQLICRSLERDKGKSCAC